MTPVDTERLVQEVKELRRCLEDCVKLMEARLAEVDRELVELYARGLR